VAIQSKIINRIDILTLAIYFLLVILGWLNIYSSSYQDNPEFSLSTRYGKQLIVIGINIFLLIAVLFLDVNFIPNISYITFAIIIVALIAVLFFGDITGGSKSWFIIGSFKLQPAEFAKLAVALALSRYIGNDNFKNLRGLKKYLTIFFIIVLPAVLILLQGDAGSALVFSIFILVLYRTGLSFYWLLLIFIQILVFSSYFYFKYEVIFIFLLLIAFISEFLISSKIKNTLNSFLFTLSLILTGLVFVIFFNFQIKLHLIIFLSYIIYTLYNVFKYIRKKNLSGIIMPIIFVIYMASIYSVNFLINNVLEEHQRTRINVLFGKETDLTGVGYNVHQSKIAIGSGGFSGKGFLQGTQTKYDFVPEQDTDFIFCTVGEEWGFIGTTLIIALFTVFFIRIILLSERQKSSYSRIFGYSLASILFFHFSVNIAMTIGLAPVIGIPLPFFSYGGSSLIAFSIFLFLFLRLDAERNTLLV
jgi:rod shape determining protein RodA